MLAITRREHEPWYVWHPAYPNEILKLEVIEIDRNKARVGMDFPDDYAIWRGEMSETAIADIKQKATEKFALKEQSNGSSSE